MVWRGPAQGMQVQVFSLKVLFCAQEAPQVKTHFRSVLTRWSAFAAYLAFPFTD